MYYKILFFSYWVHLIEVICAGGYDKEEKAARAYDLAALKYWGQSATTNFPVLYIFRFLHHSCLYNAVSTAQ